MSDAPRESGATEELDSLLGAYALDALDADDRARVDAYLANDATARAEVDEMRETAASLALLPPSGMDAPQDLWDRISDEIASEPKAETPGIDEVAARRTRRARATWIAPTIAAAAVILLVVLAVQVVSLQGRLDDANDLGPDAVAAAFDRATKVDGARAVDLNGASGATLARVVLLPDGTGYLRGDRLDALPADQTYQLWAVTGSEDEPVVVSAGVLGSDPKAVAFRASGPVRAFAVTVEDAPGVVTSEQTPIAQAVVA
jgi:anti-sigma-K factor RskA